MQRRFGTSRALPTLGVTTGELEKQSISHHVPTLPGDYLALSGVRCLRWCAHACYRDRHLHRAFTLVALAPAFPMAAIWVSHFAFTITKPRFGITYGDRSGSLVEEFHNKQMHYAAMAEVSTMLLRDRICVAVLQFFFAILYASLSVFFPRIGYRFLAYLAEEGSVTLTHFVNDIDSGQIPDLPATELMAAYWGLSSDASLRDVVLRIRSDTMTHRDWNHHRANK